MDTITTSPSPCRALQLAELDILKRLVQLCDRYGIPYFALGGTLLGAVRHQGFIPWDDDVDIGIPREEYRRFLAIAREELAAPYAVKTFWEDADYPYYFSRVVNARVEVADRSAIQEKRQYAWIDIFPLDGMPSGRFRRTVQKYRLLYARLLFQYSRFSSLVSVALPNRPLHERLLIRLGRLLPVERWVSPGGALKRLDALLTRYSYAESDYVVNLMGAGKFKEMFPKSVYEDTALYRFEDMTLKGPADYDRVLTQMYGDYLTPPPEAERNKHFTEVVEVAER